MRSFVPRSFVLLSSALALAAVHGMAACGGETTAGGASSSSSSSSSSSGGGGGAVLDGGPDDKPLVPASKVDLLLVVDNSASMGDKSALLADSVGTLIRDVAKVGDIHVGVITTSLGNFGGDVCPANNAAANMHAHLVTKGPGGAAVPGAETGVLAYKGGDVEPFVSAAASLVRGVGENGCGLEAQLESAYRFLVQPDPWTDIKVGDDGKADLGDSVDVDVLTQRKAFLRKDSALVVVLLTDEDDSSADPLAVSGQGWAFEAKNFPGSNVLRGQGQGTTASRGTSACDTNPASADCRSCAFQFVCSASDPSCQKLQADPNCQLSGLAGRSGPGYSGYYAPTDDDLNVRFFHMKQRFGIDPQYPIQRYIDGFTNAMVPDRSAEHPVTGSGADRVIGAYAGTPKCTNPIFADSLPSQAGDELCNLPRGPRSRELVLFAVLGGLPPALGTDTPDWTKLLGQNPDAYDYAGIDPHMIQSTEPRAGLPAPAALGDNGTDPVHGREWTTNKSDLQYACTFALPTPRTCSASDASCDCPPDGSLAPPLCGSTPGQQVRAKAYPTPRPLRLAKGLADRGVVGSICSESYDATMKALSARLAARLAK